MRMMKQNAKQKFIISSARKSAALRKLRIDLPMG